MHPQPAPTAASRQKNEPENTPPAPLRLPLGAHARRRKGHQVGGLLDDLGGRLAGAVARLDLDADQQRVALHAGGGGGRGEGVLQLGDELEAVEGDDPGFRCWFVGLCDAMRCALMMNVNV
jgi:hypothetical protein